jgi:hypothetical protein
MRLYDSSMQRTAHWTSSKREVSGSSILSRDRDRERLSSIVIRGSGIVNDRLCLSSATAGRLRVGKLCLSRSSSHLGRLGHLYPRDQYEAQDSTLAETWRRESERPGLHHSESQRSVLPVQRKAFLTRCKCARMSDLTSGPYMLPILCRQSLSVIGKRVRSRFFTHCTGAGLTTCRDQKRAIRE